MSASEFPTTFVDGFHDVDAVRRMEYRHLASTGIQVSKLSFGVSSIGSVFRPTEDVESYDVIETALKSGINWIDAAPWYGFGKGESVFGAAIEKKMIPRKAYYLSTKVGRYNPERRKMFDFSAERTIRSVDESLQRMRCDYVDLIQVHDMEFAPSLDVIVNETLPALQKVKESGKARFIGITGYPLENFVHVLERSAVKVDTVMSYCRYCLFDTGLDDILPLLNSKGVGVFSASANGMGLLTEMTPPKWHPASDRVKKACQSAVEYCATQQVDISRLGVSFSCQNLNIHSTMISTASLKNLGKNIDAATRPLDENELRVLAYAREHYFVPLNNENWGWTDVEKHWRKVKEDEKMEKVVP